MGRLRRSDCSEPGIIRRRRGRGFQYLDESGRQITDPEVVARIRDLRIPPAWKDVWICPYPNGHLQAVGRDAAGRKQYLYHESWRRSQDQKKFDRMLGFARVLPKVRGLCQQHLSLEGFARERVLACAVKLADVGFFRIGCEEYADEHDTYGLATMEKRHVKIEDDLVTFDYVSKGGQRRIQALVDPTIASLLSSLKRRRGGGSELLAYKDGRVWTDVRSSDINDYIRDVSGGDFTMKDFRTWAATVLAAVAVAVSGQATMSKTARKRAIARAVKEVASYLGNTPAVCRSSYIDPRVFDRFRSGWTIAGALDALGEDTDFGAVSTQGAIEAAVIDLLEQRESSEALERVA